MPAATSVRLPQHWQTPVARIIDQRSLKPRLCCSKASRALSPTPARTFDRRPVMHSPLPANVRCQALISAFCGRQTGGVALLGMSGTRSACVTPTPEFLASSPATLVPITHVSRICNPAASGEAPQSPQTANHPGPLSQHEINWSSPGATLTCGTTIAAHTDPQPCPVRDHLQGEGHACRGE
jgi:hypothetical protein